MNWRAQAVRARLGRPVVPSDVPKPDSVRPSDPAAPRTTPRAIDARATGGPAQTGPSRIGRALARLLLVSVGWAAWRVARRPHQSRRLQARVGPHARYWEEFAQRHGEILYVAVGDSTAQGLGARDPGGSYVGQLERRLPVRLRVINLSISGARLSDVASALLPRLAALDTTRALVTFAAGADDIADFDPRRFRRELATILDALPPHALVLEIPSFYVRPHQVSVRAANAILHDLADARDLAVVPLHNLTNRFGPAALATHHAADLRHPNDRGYRLWAQALLGPAGARLEEIVRGD